MAKKLKPQPRKKKKAKATAQVYDKTTPRREGCGWLIGQDLTYQKP